MFSVRISKKEIDLFQTYVFFLSPPYNILALQAEPDNIKQKEKDLRDDNGFVLRLKERLSIGTIDIDPPVVQKGAVEEDFIALI